MEDFIKSYFEELKKGSKIRQALYISLWAKESVNALKGIGGNDLFPDCRRRIDEALEDFRHVERAVDELLNTYRSRLSDLQSQNEEKVFGFVRNNIQTLKNCIDRLENSSRIDIVKYFPQSMQDNLSNATRDLNSIEERFNNFLSSTETELKEDIEVAKNLCIQANSELQTLIDDATAALTRCKELLAGIVRERDKMPLYKVEEQKRNAATN